MAALGPQKYFNFRAYLEFGGGQITDLFTHWIDVVHMFMEQDNPVAAVASGGIYQYKDGRTAPDTILCALDYPEGWTATFEATLAPGKKGAAVEMVGTQGSLYIDRGHYVWNPVDGKPVEVQAERKEGIDVMTQAHVDNFVDCVKSRELPNGDVWIGHRSAQASHLGNIAYLQKRRVKFDPHFEEILPL
ncbi:MAG: Gfo/Idh/MocA family oxidoreductase [Bryobacterales bacterium]